MLGCVLTNKNLSCSASGSKVPSKDLRRRIASPAWAYARPPWVDRCVAAGAHFKTIRPESHLKPNMQHSLKSHVGKAWVPGPLLLSKSKLLREDVILPSHDLRTRSWCWLLKGLRFLSSTPSNPKNSARLNRINPGVSELDFRTKCWAQLVQASTRKCDPPLALPMSEWFETPITLYMYLEDHLL